MCKNVKNVKTPALAPRFGNLGLMCNKEVRDLCGAGQGARPLGVRRCRWHPRAGQGAALACPDPPAPEVPSPIPPPLLGAGCGGFGVFLNWFIWFCSVPPCSPQAASSASQNHDFTGVFVLIPGYAVPGVMPVHPRSPRRAGGSPSGLWGRGKRPQFLGVITHEELIGLQPERGVSC